VKKLFSVNVLIAAALIITMLVVMAACSSKSTTTTTAPATSTTTTTTTTSATPPPTTTTTTSTTPTSTLPVLTVNVSTKAGLGNYLVDGKGMTLYYFTKDSVGVSNATAAILANWPIFNPASFLVGAGLSASDFSTITRTDGQKIAAFKGWPLYYYIKDVAAGDTVGQGVGGVWFVIDPAKFPPPPATTTTTTTTTTTSTTTTTTTPTTTTTTTTVPPGPAVTLSLVAQNISFDKTSLTVAAGSSVTLNFNNMDTGIPHNVSIYQNLAGGQVKAIFVGQIITGPNTITYTFTAPAAGSTYFFQCDVHPSMTGTFVVTAPAAAGGGY
jgi:predicted lipoprotein with Yx(FWY)xxD motif/plastocyanin